MRAQVFTAALLSLCPFSCQNETTGELKELQPLPSPRGWGPNATLIYLRVQKAGSKTLVQLFESNGWWLSEKRPVQCLHTFGWIGETSTHCYKRFEQLMRNLDPLGSLPCVIHGHCGLYEVTSGISSYVNPRHLIITLIREPAARVLSEYRHVCYSGANAWDYSTKVWRSSTRSIFILKIK